MVHKPTRKTPWRDNIEALTVAIIMAVMFKYFIVEAYKIPTGSMQPTLMGNDETGIFDRILVDKLSFHFRDPERFEVVVFKYPLDRSKNFIKRIVGMPGEELRIWNGDVWTRKSAAEPWKILRRPQSVQHETWKPLQLGEDAHTFWKASASGWTSVGRNISAHGDGRAQFVLSGAAAIFDDYAHGYPPKMAAQQHPPPGLTRHNVGDLRVSADVRATSGCKEVAVEFDEGPRHYTLAIPGPAAAADATPKIRVKYGAPDIQSSSKFATEASGKPYRLPANKSVSIGGQNLDDLLSLEIDGDFVCELEIAQAADNAPSTWTSSAYLSQQGEGADFQSVQTWRDIFYTADSKVTELVIPEGQYFMLGDNTQNSSDGREWTFACMKWPGEGSKGEVVRGNSRLSENPVSQMTDDGVMTTFFRDEWGELWTFPTQSQERLAPEQAPTVPRSLICGRAVFVFWPLVPSLDVYRLKWVH